MWRIFLTVGVTTLLTAVGLTVLTLRWTEHAQTAEITSLTERSAVALDMQFNTWKTAINGLANSHSLVRELDTEILREEAERMAAYVGGWVALMPLDDLSLHIFNTNFASKEPARTSGPAPELVEAVARSRASGQAEVSDVFVGRASQREIFTVVKVAKASTGDELAVVLAVDIGVLSHGLESARLTEGDFISAVDGSERIVARSSRIGDFFLLPVPDWLLDLAKEAAPATTLIAKGRGVSGTDGPTYLFARHML